MEKKGNASRILKGILCLRIFKMMKITTFLVCYSFFSCLASGTYSQSTKISLDLKQTTIQDALKEIENTSNYYFLYNNDLVNVRKRVSLKAEHEDIHTILEKLFKGEPVKYVVMDRQIIISPADETERIAGEHDVRGVVYDSDGKSLPGVTVTLKGTTTGTITDVDGKYNLSGVPDNAILVFSFVGMKRQEITVGQSAVINVTMRNETIGIEEVVAIGYGTTTRKDFTGSVSQVKMEDSPLALAPRTDAMDALRGTVPGMSVSQQQGAGQSPSLLIRGQKSVNGGTDPLIVLDGVIFMGAMRDIDPSTIESISVLKDATSIAVYGSRAANGVVMITTQKGKQGKPVINFRSSFGFSKVINKADVLSPEKWIEKVNLLQGLDKDTDPTSWMSDFEDENYKAGKTTDWQDLIERTGTVQDHYLSVSGINDRTSYFMSASYASTEGVLEGDDYNRTALTSKLSTNITDWLEVGGNINFSFNDYSGPTDYDIYSAIRMTPYGRVYRNGENNLLEKYPATEGLYRTNPLWNVKSGTIDDHDVYYTTILNGHMQIKCPWIKGLSYRVNYSYTKRDIERDYFTHEGYYVAEGTSDDRYSSETLSNYLASANGYSARTKDIAWVWDNIVNYKHSFGKHSLDLTAVYTRDSYKYYYKKVTGLDFSELGNTELGYNGLTYAATQEISDFNNTKKNNIGYLGRMNYSYANKYHFTVSVRRDGSSVFGENKKWGVFPSAGAAWTVSEENFMKNVTPVNYLKLKFSWGQNGNQSLDPYETLSRLSLGQSGGFSYPFGNTSEVSWGQRVSSLGNSDLGWEKTTAFNTGFELSMYNSRISLNADVYFSKTTSQIFSRTIPVMANGITSIEATMGQVNNHGIEITLSSRNIKFRNFRWNSTLTYYLNRNKLKELYGDGKDDISNSLFLGKSLGAIYGYKQIGIVQENDAGYIEANGAQAGDVKFWDKSGDGKITSDDRCILGYNKDNFRMSFANTFKYKDFELYALFTGIFGGNGYYKSANIYAYRTASDVVWDNNFDHGWWTSENASNKYPRIGYTDSRYTPVQGRSFVRLQNISLSYTFRQPWVQKLSISNLKVYVSATNLFTITGWDGGDPETGQTLGSGYNYGYPLSSTCSMGISLTF